jgi:predicted pyridoxine 5'-phosphate oxidase superfamily flavin-nucleotide-binding protein
MQPGPYQKGGKQPKKLRNPPPPPKFIATDDPALVTIPDPIHIDPSMEDAYCVNNKNRMCLIFDVVSPARKFKRGTVYEEIDGQDPFADYDTDPEKDPNVTESDDDVATQPYIPINHE